MTPQRRRQIIRHWIGILSEDRKRRGCIYGNSTVLIPRVGGRERGSAAALRLVLLGYGVRWVGCGYAARGGGLVIGIGEGGEL